jgi:CHASE3 domain sensor protein
MTIPLVAVLTAAPGVIASVTEIVKAIRSLRKSGSGLNEKTIKDIEELLEKQAVALSELAESNRNLALAVRNNRILAGVALVVAIGALVTAILR